MLKHISPIDAVSPNPSQVCHSSGRWSDYGSSSRSFKSYSSRSVLVFQEVLFHEAGHATVAEALMPGSVKRIVVNKCGVQTDGFCEHKPITEIFYDLIRKGISDDFWEASVSIAGKAAVEQNLGMVGEGCSEDFEKAVSALLGSAAWDYVCKHNVPKKEQLTVIVRKKSEIHALALIELNKVYSKTKEILSANKNLLSAIVSELSRKLILSASELAEIERRFPPIMIPLHDND